MLVTVWTLTVSRWDGGLTTSTDVCGSQQEARDVLRAKYAADSGVPDADLVDYVESMDNEVAIESVVVDVPDEAITR